MLVLFVCGSEGLEVLEGGGAVEVCGGCGERGCDGCQGEDRGCGCSVHGFTSKEDCRRRERPTGLAILIGTESQGFAPSRKCPPKFTPPASWRGPRLATIRLSRRWCTRVLSWFRPGPPALGEESGSCFARMPTSQNRDMGHPAYAPTRGR